MESHEHLFGHCPYTMAVLATCPIPLQFSWTRFLNGNIVCAEVDVTRRNVASLFVATAFHSIWKERNLRAFNPGHSISPSNLANAVRVKIKEKLFTCPLFKIKARRDVNLQTMLY